MKTNYIIYIVNLDESNMINNMKKIIFKDEIKKMIGDWLSTQTTQHWLDILEPADIWCAEVLDWEKMLNHEGFKVLDQAIEHKDKIIAVI